MEGKLVKKGDFCLSTTGKALKVPDCELGRAIHELGRFVPLPLNLCPLDAEEASKNATSLMVWITQADWESICCWVAMQQFKAFSINNAPISLRQMEASAPAAKVSIAELNLWAAIFNLFRESQEKLSYGSPIQGWLAVQIERKRLAFRYMDKSFGARSFADDWRDTLGYWRDKTGRVLKPENPFEDHRKSLPAHFNMVEAALSIVRADCALDPLTRKLKQNFVDQEWTAYLDAIQGLIKAYREPRELTGGYRAIGTHLFVQDNQIFLNEKTGKRVLFTSSPRKHRFSNRGRKSI